MFVGKYWIEGIGSTGGLLKPFYPTEFPTCEDCCGVEDNLVCLTNNNEVLFLNDNYYDCDSLFTSIENLTVSYNIDISVVENNLLSINTNSENIIRAIEVYNQTGKLIIKQKVNKMDQFQIRLPVCGLYIIKVSTKDGETTKKIIIKNNCR